MKKKINRFVPIGLYDVVPGGKAVFSYQGIPKGATVPDRIHALFTDAMDIFVATVHPAGIISEISTHDFKAIFEGEGENAHDALLKHIFPRADKLALCAITLGRDLSAKIKDLFGDNNFALGAMLDAVASSAAEKAVEFCESFYGNYLIKKNPVPRESVVLNYSPGYCGWHVSGQKKLFGYLHPERIGISLNGSCLMTPIKSVTGLLVAGKKEIHIFTAGRYSYCDACQDRTCIDRIKILQKVSA